LPWLATVLAFTLTPLAAISAGDAFIQPYIATYQTKAYRPEIKRTIDWRTRVSGDGHGNVRTQTLTPDGSMVSSEMLYLATNRTDYCLDKYKKQSQIFNKDSQECQAFSQDWVSKPPTSGFKPIGTKVIANHPSHGYKGSANGTDTEVWIADDLGIPVLTKVRMQSEDIVSTLLDCKRNDQKAAFALPANYEVCEAISRPYQPMNTEQKQYWADYDADPFKTGIIGKGTLERIGGCNSSLEIKDESGIHSALANVMGMEGEFGTDDFFALPEQVWEDVQKKNGHVFIWAWILNHCGDDEQAVDINLATGKICALRMDKNLLKIYGARTKQDLPELASTYIKELYKRREGKKFSVALRDPKGKTTWLAMDLSKGK